MKSVYLKIQIIMICVITNGFSQSKDTLIDVGKYKLNFNIIKGEGTAILFESGSGNDSSIWSDLVQPIAEITGSTIITYDRAGIGNSIINPENNGIDNNTILDGVEALEIGLKKLGYDDDIILVAHSFGGLYATLFAARNEKKVKQVVFIDASLAGFYTESFVNSLNARLPVVLLNQFKEQKPGLYYEIKNVGNTLELLNKTEFPTSVPVIDLVASEPYNPLKNDDDKQRWIANHEAFANTSVNRELLIINDANHYIFKDQSELVINVVVKAYVNTLSESGNKEILLRALDFSIKERNKTAN